MSFEVRRRSPTPDATQPREALRQALSQHPKLGPQELNVRLSPQSPSEPVRQLEVDQANIKREFCTLIVCELNTLVTPFSEDQLACAERKRCHVGIGHLHSTYEVFMDDNAIYTHPLSNHRFLADLALVAQCS